MKRIVLFCLLLVSPVWAETDVDLDNNMAVDITYGGTNASTASGARTNLGLAIGTDVQAYDADLDSASAASDQTTTKWWGYKAGTGVGFHDFVASGSDLPDGNSVGDLLRWDGDSWEPVSSFTGLTIGGFTVSTAVEANDSGNLVSIADPGANALRYWKEATNVMEWMTLDTGDFVFSTNELKVKKYVPTKQKDFVVKTPVDADDFLLFKSQTAITVTDIHCFASGGTSIAVDIQECDSAGANCATVDAAITCDTDGAEDDGTLSNGAIDAGDWVKVVMAAPTGTVNFLTVSIYYVETAD
jgi:hypothetical protein